MKRIATLSTAVMFAVACGGGEPPAADMAMDDPDIMPTGEATPMPANWSVRLDQADADASGFRIQETGGAVEVQTGPAGIAYDAADAVTGDYAVSATFTEVGAPAGHREGLGLFIGGQDLEGAGQRYTYFLVRGDGSYLIKRRNADATMNVSDGWMADSSVAAAEGQDDVVNMLSVTRVGDLVHFAVNGSQVATLPASEVDTEGVAGLRINHNLHVRVADWSVQR